MKYVAMKLKCNSLAEYKREAVKVRRAKYLALGGLLLIYAPAVNLSYIISVTTENPSDYFLWIVGLLVINRLVFAATEFYVYFQYTTLLQFFIEKKRQIIRFRLSARASSQVKGSKRFTPFNRFVISWISILTVLKLSHTLFILIVATVFQLSTEYRSETFKRAVLVIQRLYIPLIDVLIVSSLLYYFYYQGASLKALREGKKKVSTLKDAGFDEDETFDSDGVGTQDVKDLLLNGTDMEHHHTFKEQEIDRKPSFTPAEPENMFGSAAKKAPIHQQTGNFDEDA